MTDAPEDTAATLAPPDAALQFDLAMVLVECHRDRRGDGVFHPDASAKALEQLAALIAPRLATRIGGRYIPRRCERDRIGERNAAVMAAFDGRNHRQVMRDFDISRRLLYSILARCRKRPPG